MEKSYYPGIDFGEKNVVTGGVVQIDFLARIQFETETKRAGQIRL